LMCLIGVVSSVEGMSKYVEEKFMGRILGANTFTLRRFPWFGNHVTEAEWRSWMRRPRIYPRDARLVRDVTPPGTRWAIESAEILYATAPNTNSRPPPWE